MAWVQRHRHRRPQVDVAEPQHEVGGAGDDLLHGALVGQSVDAADEVDVVRAPWCVGAHRQLVALHRSHRLAVAPAERQMDGAPGHRQPLGRRQRGLQARELVDQRVRGQPVGVVLDVQGANSGGDVEHAGQPGARQRVLQPVHAHARAQVEHRLAELDEHGALARAPVCDETVSAVLGTAGGDPRRAWAPPCGLLDIAVAGSPRHALLGRRGHSRPRRRAFAQLGLRSGVKRRRLVDLDRLERHAIACAQLAEAPQVGADHLCDRRKPAEARAVRSNDHRHVAGEHDRADAVSAVEDVRRVQPGLAAVGARPVRARADESYSCAVRVLIDDPARLEQLLQSLLGQELGSAVRAEHDAKRRLVAQLGESALSLVGVCSDGGGCIGAAGASSASTSPRRTGRPASIVAANTERLPIACSPAKPPRTSR